MAATVSRSQTGVDPSSFDGVAAALSQLYTPYDKYTSGPELYQAILEGRVPDHLEANVSLMSKNVAAIEDSLFPALPRADALKAALLRSQLADQEQAMSNLDGGLVNSRRWHSSHCHTFLDMQDSYKQLVDSIAAHDPVLHEENRKREKAEHRASRISEERAAFNRRQRFQETINSISGN